MSKRIGRFEIYKECLRRERRALDVLLAQVKIESETIEDFGLTHVYLGESPLFDPVDDGAEVPLYRIICTRHEDGWVTCKFEREKAPEVPPAPSLWQRFLNYFRK